MNSSAFNPGRQKAVSKYRPGLPVHSVNRWFHPAPSYKKAGQRRIHHRRLWLVLAVIGIITVAFPVYGGTIVDRVVAVVNDEVISLYDLNQRIRPYAEKIRETTTNTAEQDELLRKLREEYLDLLIHEKLADQEVRRLGIKVGEAEVDREIERFKSVNQLTDEAFEQALIAQGKSLDEFRRQIREQLLRARLVNREIRSKIVITQKEIFEYYQAHPEEFGGGKKYFLRNILMMVPDSDSRTEKTDVLDRLKHVHAKLLAGESFEALARRYSEAPNAADGGLLGFISHRTLAPQIQKALAALKPGDFTDIIETEQGYQIFLLEDIEISSAAPFEQVKPKIEDKLYNQIITRQYETWLQELRARAHIKLIL